jgi:DNA-binding CsgD family transcriptional regulator
MRLVSRSLAVPLKILESAAGTPVAPHIAARLDSFARSDERALRELAVRLRAEQLDGHSSLPDPLPAVPAIRSSVATEIPALSPAARRLLLVAAVSVLDRLDVLLAAAAIDIDVVLTEGLKLHLLTDAGRYRFADPRLRSVVIEDATPADRSAAHASLARALRSHARPSVAVWHAAFSASPGQTPRPTGVIGLIDQLLAHGDLHAAHALATHTAPRMQGPFRGRAYLLAGKAALWSGHLLDAADCFARARDAGSDHRAESNAALKVIRRMKEGAVEHPDTRTRVLIHMRPLADMTATNADHLAMMALREIFDAWWNDPDEADAIQARLFLARIPAREPWPWATDHGALSPLAEAYVCLMQAAFQMQVDDMHGAAATLSDGMARLPLVIVGAGLVASLLRIVGRHRPQVWAVISAFETLAPDHSIQYEISGPSTGSRASAAARPTPKRAREHIDRASPWVALLTAREHEVLRLVMDGLTNQAIADGIQVSARTVEVHISRIFRKAGVRSRSELLVQVFRSAPDPIHSEH